MGGDPLTSDRLSDRIVRTALVFVPLTVVALVGAVKLLASTGTPFATGGDDGVTELMVRAAASFELTYGPYSRFEWRHPGPMFFYALAPSQAMFGVRGMFLGVWTVNVAAALCAVWVVRRRAGDLVAMWAGAVLCVLLLVHVPTKELWLAWNPAVLTVPLVLAAVLAAAAWAGSRLSFAGTLLVASFLVQAHVGVVPIVALTVAVATAGLVRDVVRQRRRRDAADATAAGAADDTRRRRRRAVAWAAAAVVFVGMWSAPLLDVAVSGGGNLVDLAEFFVSGGGDTAGTKPTAAQALGAVTRRVATFPLGADPWDRPTLDAAPLSVSRVAVSALLLLLAGAVTWRCRRRLPFAAALGAWSVVAFPVAWLSVANISDGVQAYLIWWLAAVPVPAVIGAGAWTVHALRSRYGDAVYGSTPRVVTAAVCALPALVLAVAVARAPQDPGTQWPQGPAAAERLLADPATSTTGGVRVTPAQDSWPENAALAAALARDGVEVTVSDDWLFMYGNLLSPTGDESVAASLLRPGDDPDALLGPDARDLGPVGTDGARLWVSP